MAIVLACGLPRLITEFIPNAANEVGLIDYDTVRLAKDLKAKYGSFDDYRVHIWTTDAVLKSLEPDREPDPFLG
ncbi:MAG: hypothetical protein ACOX6T_13495 [Myxococcales bacterium]|jgi:hypothetical protein